MILEHLKLWGFLLCLLFVGVLGIYVGRKSVSPVVQVKEVPVDRIVDRVVTKVVTKTIHVQGKPDVVIVTKTSGDTKEDDKTTYKAEPVELAPAATATYSPKWSFRLEAGGELDHGDINALFGLGVERHYGHFTLGAEALTDAKSHFLLLGTAGVEF